MDEVQQWDEHMGVLSCACTTIPNVDDQSCSFTPHMMVSLMRYSLTTMAICPITMTTKRMKSALEVSPHRSVFAKLFSVSLSRENTCASAAVVLLIGWDNGWLVNA